MTIPTLHNKVAVELSRTVEQASWYNPAWEATYESSEPSYPTHSMVIIRDYPGGCDFLVQGGGWDTPAHGSFSITNKMELVVRLYACDETIEFTKPDVENGTTEIVHMEQMLFHKTGKNNSVSSVYMTALITESQSMNTLLAEFYAHIKTAVNK